jgi:chromosome segregation ATPase
MRVEGISDMADVTREEFAAIEARVRVIENEITGEKAVTRHVLQQAGHNRDDIAAIHVDLATLKLQADRMGSELVLIKAAQTSHGSLLNVLSQDIRELRTETADIRRDLRSEMGDLRSEMGGVRSEIGKLHSEIDEIRTGLNRQDERLGAQDERLDRLAQDIAAIRAAVVPGGA